jgi:hypothetical protein
MAQKILYHRSNSQEAAEGTPRGQREEQSELSVDSSTVGVGLQCATRRTFKVTKDDVSERRQGKERHK